MTPEEKSLLTRAFHILSRIDEGKTPASSTSILVWKSDYEKLMKKKQSRGETASLLEWGG